MQAVNSCVLGCFYCTTPWDDYKLCSSNHCFQLVLICTKCRTDAGRTSCCVTCQVNQDQGKSREMQCECTKRRERIPQEMILKDKKPEANESIIQDKILERNESSLIKGSEIHCDT